MINSAEHSYTPFGTLMNLMSSIDTFAESSYSALVPNSTSTPKVPGKVTCKDRLLTGHAIRLISDRC